MKEGSDKTSQDNDNTYAYLDPANVPNKKKASLALQRLNPSGRQRQLKPPPLSRVLHPKPVVVAGVAVVGPLRFDERRAHRLLERRGRAKLHVREHRVDLLDHAGRAEDPAHLWWTRGEI